MSKLTFAPLEEVSCRPNFAEEGRRRRLVVAVVLSLLALGTFVGLVLAHAPAWARLFVALPTAAAAVTALQVTRSTCVAHAAAGTVEHADFTATKAEAAFAAASRRVARTILRDGVLLGVVAGLVGYGSAWIVE